MFKKFLLFSLSCTLSVISYSQVPSIKGVAIDAGDKQPVAGATVSLLLKKDSTVLDNQVTDANGAFQFNDLATDSFIVKLNMVNYQEYLAFVNLKDNASRNLGQIGLTKQGKDLAVVTVVSQGSAVVQKGDTVQMSASQYKVNPDATTEDLIKKMPGITVAKDGTVTAQGETVKKVTIDGKDFFGDDASAALRNLPSQVVDKIQVFDKLSDQAQLTGIDDGNSQKAINVVTKSGIKNGQFGRIYAGYGTDDRYAAGGNISFFKGDRRISLVGNFNNVNQQNFGSQDLLGLTSSGGGRRGGGGGRGGWGGGDNFSVGQSNGISRTNAFGVNYSNQFGPKLSLTSSYFFNSSQNNNDYSNLTETFKKDGRNLFTSELGQSESDNYNHRFNARLEWKLDSNNTIYIIPSVSLQGNNSVSNSYIQNYYGINDSTSISNVMSEPDRSGYNVRNNIMYRHAFAKKGRTFSLGFNTTFSRNSGETITDGYYRFFNNGLGRDSLRNQFADNLTTSKNYSGNINYTEPVSKNAIIQFEYSPSVQLSNADQKTYLFDGNKYSLFDTRLSNKFDNTISTNRGGVTYRYAKGRDEMFFIGLNMQATTLKSERLYPTETNVSQSFSNLLPIAMYRKKLSAASNLNIFYRSYVNFPSVNQLQDVVDISNPLRVSVGNPLLKQSPSQFLSARYSYTNSKSARSFFANVFAQSAKDYITNATYIASSDSLIQSGDTLKAGSQLTRPVNLDGYRNLRTFFTYSMPLKFIKTTLNLNAGVSYSKLPGLTNNAPTTTDNFAYNTGVVLASNISEYVDFNLNFTANFNTAKNSFNTSLNNKYVNYVSGITLNLLDKKGWFIQNDVNNQTYTGLTAGFNQSYWLWNAAIGKKFLKSKAAELKLSVFDLLKQNQSIAREITESYIKDSQTQVLQQYFMLTFTYSLKNFGTGKAPKAEEGRGMMRGGGMMF